MTEPSQTTIEMVFGFPKAGEVYGSFDVQAASIDTEKEEWSVTFGEKVSKKYATQALSPFLGKVALFEVEGVDYSVEFPKKTKIEFIRINPPGLIQTVISGTYNSATALTNPTTVAEFDDELGRMTVVKPTKWFRVHPLQDLHGPKFRKKLWTFVNRRGESYGWVVGDEIYHRKGSLIMPYVKINKHIENAKVMYHTHPSKDEPSFTSADDIQWYLDCAYKWNIRHYYTVMANRIDYFEIKTKGEEGKKRYMKMDEGKFITDMDTLLTKTEEEYRTDDTLSDEKFCEKTTRHWIKDLNQRFGHLMEITYHSYIKQETPLPNPGSDTPFDSTTKIKVEDKYISRALGELQGLNYDWIHYGGDEYSHTMYVYWWLKYHFLPKVDGTDRLWAWEKKGLDQENRQKLRAYLKEEVENGWTKGDVLLIMGLYHDIAKKREKEQKIHHAILGADMFSSEIAPELGLPQNLADHITIMLSSDVGRKNIGINEFKTIAGDLYGICKMVHMADRTAHHPYMYTVAARVSRREGSLETGQYGDAYIEMANERDIKTLAEFFSNRSLSNPPPKMPSTVTYQSSYEIAIEPDTAEMLFGEYDPRKVAGNDGGFAGTFLMSYRQGLYLKMPLSDGYVASATLTFKFPANLNITGVPVRDDYGKSGALEIYQRVGQILSEVYEPKLGEAETEEYGPTTSGGEIKQDVLPEGNEDFPVLPMVNPRPKGITLVIAGPLGSGRREIAQILTKHGYQICPMHTTEVSPPNRIPNKDSVDHDNHSFMLEVQTGNMPYWTIDKEGNKFGYTRPQLDAPKSIMYTTPQMATLMKESMPQITTVYIDNNQTTNEHISKLTSRKGIPTDQAKAIAKYSHHLKQKRNQFDVVLPVKGNNFQKAAKTLATSKKQDVIIINPRFDVEDIEVYTTIPDNITKNFGAVTAEIAVDRNIPKELVGAVKDIFKGLIEDYKKQTDQRIALAIAYAVEEMTEDARKLGANAIVNFTVESGGGLGLPLVEFNRTVPGTIMCTGDAVIIEDTKKNPRMSGSQYRKGVKKVLEGKKKKLDHLRGIYYHGSPVGNLKKLQPSHSHLVGREVVYATPHYEFAVSMSVESSNDDLEIGYINDEFTIAEVYDGAFDLLKVPGYVYQVQAKGFHQHPRLQPMEYIIEISIPIKKAKRLPNVYKELKRLGTTFISYR
jgi:uncharacterized protein YbjQ (UPF0145 family)